MNGRLLLAAAVPLALSGLAAAGVALLRPAVGPPADAPAAPRLGPPVGPSAGAPPAPSTGPVHPILARNLFAPDRRPPARRYGDAGATPEPRAGRPDGSLTLVGVLLGASRAAVVQGVPGASGDRVVAIGDTVGTYRLIAVTSEAAVLVSGRDTVRLVLREVR